MQSSIIEKLITVLTLVSEASTPPTFTKLLLISGYNKSTMHRMLMLCINGQLLQFDKEKKAYLIGPKIFNFVRNSYKGYDIQVIALDEMICLYEMIQVNITLGIPHGFDTVYLRVIDAKKSMGSMMQPGMREPFHCSASGKAWVAYLPDSVADNMLSNHKFEKFTNQTISNAQEFKTAIENVRNVGFATNDREEYNHLVGISAPIFNYMSEPIAVLNIWTHHDQYSITSLSEWAPELKKSAAKVTGLIGGVPPSLDSLKSTVKPLIRRE